MSSDISGRYLQFQKDLWDDGVHDAKRNAEELYAMQKTLQENGLIDPNGKPAQRWGCKWIFIKCAKFFARLFCCQSRYSMAKVTEKVEQLFSNWLSTQTIHQEGRNRMPKPLIKKRIELRNRLHVILTTIEKASARFVQNQDLIWRIDEAIKQKEAGRKEFEYLKSLIVHHVSQTCYQCPTVQNDSRVISIAQILHNNASTDDFTKYERELYNKDVKGTDWGAIVEYNGDKHTLRFGAKAKVGHLKVMLSTKDGVTPAPEYMHLFLGDQRLENDVEIVSLPDNKQPDNVSLRLEKITSSFIGEKVCDAHKEAEAKRRNVTA